MLADVILASLVVGGNQLKKKKERKNTRYRWHCLKRWAAFFAVQLHKAETAGPDSVNQIACPTHTP